MEIMHQTGQLKIGKERVSNSQEAWLEYYVFAAATVTVLGGGYLLLQRADISGTDDGLALLGILILAAACMGISIRCHLLGHIVDALVGMQQTSPRQIHVSETENQALPAGLLFRIIPRRPIQSLRTENP